MAKATRDEGAASRFVEDFATVMVESGMPRIAARVFAYLLADDDAAATAAELAERLLDQRENPAPAARAFRHPGENRSKLQAVLGGEQLDGLGQFDHVAGELFGAVGGARLQGHGRRLRVRVLVAPR